MNKASAIANANFALIKYWGKRDTDLMLPYNSSISLTVTELETHTTVCFDESLEQDSFCLNGEDLPSDSKTYKAYIQSFLKFFRKRTGCDLPIRVVTNNSFPTGAGLASSASGFAAFAKALEQALQLNINAQDLSRIARRGSGSAARSILGGFNFWLKGSQDDGKDSHVKRIAPADFWPEIRILVCVTDTDKKPTASRSGMERTVQTCPIYQSAWLDTIQQDLDLVETAIRNKDFTTLGQVSEMNAQKMHATMLTTVPPINYWNQATKDITNLLVELRLANELEAYYTIDAGPQIKVLYQKKDQEKLLARLKELDCIEDYIICRPGPGARPTTKHLF